MIQMMRQCGSTNSAAQKAVKAGRMGAGRGGDGMDIWGRGGRQRRKRKCWCRRRLMEGHDCSAVAAWHSWQLFVPQRLLRLMPLLLRPACTVLET